MKVVIMSPKPKKPSTGKEKDIYNDVYNLKESILLSAREKINL
jgi:hypothetical protein